VRIVTIRALDHALVYAMFKRHVELRSYGGVAVVTKIRLSLGQQELWRRRAVDGMTTRTGHVGERVLGAANLGSGEIFGVTPQTVVESLNRLQQRESNDRRLPAARFNVGAPGAVTSLTAGALGRLPAAGDALIVRILIKVEPDIGMAGLAYCASDVLLFVWICWGRERARLRPDGRPIDQKYCADSEADQP